MAAQEGVLLVIPVIHTLSLDDLSLQNAWLTIGIFDGVHRGHREILRPLVSGAHAAGEPAAVLTFTPHPAVVLGGKTDFKYLTTPEERLVLLESLGVDVVITQAFSREFADQTAEEFLRHVARTLGLRRLLVLHRVVEFLLADGLFFRQRPVALHVERVLFLRGPGYRQLRLGLIERGLERRGINLEQHLPVGNRAAFRVAAAQQIAADLRRDGGVDFNFQCAHPIAVYGHVLLRDCHHFDRRQGGSRPLRLLAAANSKHGRGCHQRKHRLGAT